MDRPLLAYTLWLSYTEDQRDKLRKLFSIPRTGESVVHVGEIVRGNISGVQKQDGHRPEDLYAITLERIYDLLNTEMPEETNFYAAFQTVVDNLDDIYLENFPEARGPEPDAPEEVPAAPVASAPEPIAEEFIPRDYEELVKPKTEEPAPKTTSPKENNHDGKKKAAKPAKAH